MTDKTFKQRIHDKQTLVGVAIPMSTPFDRVKAILDQQRCDFIFTDSQHRPLDEQRLVEFCRFADDLDLPVQLRIKHTRHAYLVGRYMDLGPTAVEVPQVRLDATIDEAIASTYYPPVGSRSFGIPRQGPQVPTDRVEYARWCNAYATLCLQLESLDAVTNARRLAKPGVDYLSFGPSDLMFSLEAHPDHQLKTVMDCVRHVAQQIRDTDVALGMRTTPDTRQQYADLGVTIFLEQPFV